LGTAQAPHHRDRGYRENGNDADDSEEFDEGEGAARVRLLVYVCDYVYESGKWPDRATS
jgi:hypothetical protein